MALMNHANEALLERLLEVGEAMAAEVRSLAEDLEDAMTMGEVLAQAIDERQSPESRALMALVDAFEAARMELEGQQPVLPGVDLLTALKEASAAASAASDAAFAVSVAAEASAAAAEAAEVRHA